MLVEGCKPYSTKPDSEGQARRNEKESEKRTAEVEGRRVEENERRKNSIAFLGPLLEFFIFHAERRGTLRLSTEGTSDTWA